MAKCHKAITKEQFSTATCQNEMTKVQVVISNGKMSECKNKITKCNNTLTKNRIQQQKTRRYQQGAGFNSKIPELDNKRARSKSKMSKRNYKTAGFNSIIPSFNFGGNHTSYTQVAGHALRLKSVFIFMRLSKSTNLKERLYMTFKKRPFK